MVGVGDIRPRRATAPPRHPLVQEGLGKGQQECHAVQEVLNGFPPDNYDRGAVRHIGEVMQECYEIFTKILRRNSINAFLLSMDDKKDIATMGGRLDACI